MCAKNKLLQRYLVMSEIRALVDGACVNGAGAASWQRYGLDFRLALEFRSQPKKHCKSIYVSSVAAT